MGSLRGSRFQLDVAGHYGRPDVFEVTVHTDARAMVRGGVALVNGRSTPVAATEVAADVPDPEDAPRDAADAEPTQGP